MPSSMHIPISPQLKSKSSTISNTLLTNDIEIN